MNEEINEEINVVEKENKSMADTIPLPDIYYDCTKVCVKLSEIHARGVFAKQDIQMNETIETFPITPAHYRTKYQGDAQVIAYGYVNHTCPCEECKKHGYLVYISSGYGNMYNHQPEPNAKYKIHYKDLYGEIIAMKPIKKDEEIFINYQSTYLFHNGIVINHEN